VFLLQSDLIDLTSLRRPSAVRRWLDRERIPYVVAADGWPRVLRAVIMERLGGQIEPLALEPELILE